MTWYAILSILALALSLLATGVSIVTLRLQQSPPELSALQSKVTAIDLDLTGLADRQNTWMRRDATRKAREGKEMVQQVAPDNPQALKAALRAKVAALRGVPQG